MGEFPSYEHVLGIIDGLTMDDPSMRPRALELWDILDGINVTGCVGLARLEKQKGAHIKNVGVTECYGPDSKGPPEAFLSNTVAVVSYKNGRKEPLHCRYLNGGMRCNLSTGRSKCMHYEAPEKWQAPKPA